MTDPVIESAPTEAELREAHCWQTDDRVPRDPEMTAFRRATRYRQAQWRERHGHPIGGQPHRPRPGRAPRPVGSRIAFEYAVDTGADLVTPAALAAARARTGFVERHQSFDHQRLWADLLSSEALAFNLFADIAADHSSATELVGTWFPDAPGDVVDVRFAHSPGRLDPAYLNSLRAFDVAFVVDGGRGRHGVVAVDVKYHERMQREIPKPENGPRNREVADRSGAFVDGAADELMGRSTMCETWLEHLLLHSMLQHRDGEWTWARYVVVHPADNVDVARMLDDYRQRLVDPASITTLALQQVLDEAPVPDRARRALVDRYG